MKNEKPPRTLFHRIFNYLVIVVIVLVLAGVWLGPSGGSYGHMAVRTSTMQTARTIGLALDAYARDHDGHLPDGATSTEIFQQLIDHQYVKDPALFYVELPGKFPPANNHLTPENVAWDVTCCVDATTPPGLPVVFLTGYRVAYAPGASAVRIDVSPSDWGSKTNLLDLGIAVFRADDSAQWMKVDDTKAIPNFVPDDFDAKGETYRQLTP